MLSGHFGAIFVIFVVRAVDLRFELGQHCLKKKNYHAAHVNNDKDVLHFGKMKINAKLLQDNKCFNNLRHILSHLRMRKKKI